MARGRRIVFVDTYSHHYGGAQRMTVLLASELQRRGWSTALWVPAEGPVTAAARAAGVSVVDLGLPLALRRYGGSTFTPRASASALLAAPGAVASLRRRMREAADVVYADDHRGLLLAAPSARLARVPVIWHVHSVHPSRALNVLCSRLARRIIVPSRAIPPLMAGLGAGRPLTVIPNALLSRGEPAGRPSGGAPRIATVGRLHPEKGVDVFLRAIARVRETHPMVVADVIGPPQLGVEHHEHELLQLRAELDLDDVVTFHGEVAQPAELVSLAAVYVQPSRSEIQPLAVLEAMDLGRPVVATRAGGLVELVDDGKTGLLVPPEDDVALAAAINRLLGDPELATTLGLAGQAFARAEFDQKLFVDRIEEQIAAVVD